MISRTFSRQAGRKLESLSGINAVLSPGTIPVAFLPGKLPLVIYADATHRLLFNTYPAYENLSQLTRRHGDSIESNAYQRASVLVFASQWAADSAIKDYGADPAKVHVVPFGANLENSPARSVVEQTIAARSRVQMRLLFIGVEWERKGGPVAMAVTRHLNDMGIPTHLTIIGCSPEVGSAERPYVTVLGFIGKDSEGKHRIHEELAKSHFLIVPSSAECYGLVYCEASAFGVPAIARNVGGVSSAVRDGQNGKLFMRADSPSAIAQWAASCFRNYETYRKLALSAHAEYEAHLNWKVAGERLEKIIQSVI
jgi:glycosyltransferase involved in cell wall biosynthesis